MHRTQQYYFTDRVCPLLLQTRNIRAARNMTREMRVIHNIWLSSLKKKVNGREAETPETESLLQSRPVIYALSRQTRDPSHYRFCIAVQTFNQHAASANARLQPFIILGQLLWDKQHQIGQTV